MTSLNANYNDLKAQLRKKEFPFSARDALSKAEELLCATSQLNRQQVVKQTEAAIEILAEFVFSEDRRGLRKLNCLQELELLLVICDHIMVDGVGTEASRNSLFLLMFPPSCHSTDRMRILTSLVSLAISTKNVPVLCATAVLLQQVGCSSAFTSIFAKKLIAELFMYVTKDAPSIAELPKIAPLFTANFLTAATEAYNFVESKNKFILPPSHFIEMTMVWFRENPYLCVTPLINKFQPQLLHGAILMPPITPFVGLFRWCILSLVDDTHGCDTLFAALENLLLQSIGSSWASLGVTNSNAIRGQDLATIIPALLSVGQGHRHLNTALEHLGAVVEAAIASEKLYGPTQELWKRLESLPPSSFNFKMLSSRQPKPLP